MSGIVPNLRSATYGQFCVRSRVMKYLFGAMHSLCIRVRKIRWRNDEEVCSSVPSMCSYVRGGGTSGTNSAGCGINEGGGLPPPKQLPYRLRTLLTLRK